MRNKVLLSYLVVDGFFAVTGAIMLGFCVIVQNTMTKTFTNGEQAARDLFYQQFPLTGVSVLASVGLGETRWSPTCRPKEANNVIQRALSTPSSFS